MADYLPIVLLAVAGFLVGGVYATWKTARGCAILLAVAAVMAIVGGIGWMVYG
ncbi:hypothetical protein GCM10011581_10870 [Saccharopolyspora subtropica]|uniref:Amidotransferase n=1 Tax=Saccharopolyspora thermophila TaxID=89367 RepID=A0A917N7T1_9PSEU|nr:hypothetical protein [Saccharopolyspora subtropica]GGI75620.1 hypothetical protein GCM10011581_10870 [Saccharopolyspora subtropica]